MRRMIIIGLLVVLGLLGGNPAIAAEGGQIFGQVVLPDGVGLGGVRVLIEESGLTAMTTPSGTFRFDGIVPGKYTLVFSLGDNSSRQEDVEVAAGATTVLQQEVDWKTSSAQTQTVFSASRRTQRIVDAPAAASTVDAENIDPQSIYWSLPKLLEFSLGADISFSSLFDANVNTRGFSSSLNRRVLVLVDGRDLADGMMSAQEWSAIPFILGDISSVELVRGPGSALYGANAYNGVLNITTKEPRYSQGGRVQFGGGEEGLAGMDFRYAGKAGSDWYYKVWGGYQTLDQPSASRNVDVEYPGLPFEAVPVNQDDIQRYSGGFRADRYFPGGNILSLEMGTAHAEGPTFQTGIGRVQVDKTDRPYFRVNFNTAHFNILGYWDQRDARQIALGSGADLYEDSKKWQIEIQGHTSFAGQRGRVIGGISYRNTDVDSANRQGVQTIISQTRSDDSEAVFGQLEYDFNDKLLGIIAARWDDGSLIDGQFSPKAALVYRINMDHSIRIKYDEAFQTPNYLERFLQIPAGQPVDLSAIEDALAPYLGGVPLGFSDIPAMGMGNEKLDVEKIKNYEIGYTGIIADKAVISASYYWSRLEDFVTELLPGVNPAFAPYAPPSVLPDEVQQLILGTLGQALPPEALAAMTNDAEGNPLFAYSYGNFGKVDTEGMELGISYYPVDSLELSLYYSWLDYTIKQSLEGSSLLPNSPKNRLAFVASYSAPKYDLALRGRWIDDFYWSAGIFEGAVPSYTSIDLNFRYHINSSWDVGVIADNLLDDEHWETFGGDITQRRAYFFLGYSF